MAALQLKPAMRLHSSAKSSFRGLTSAFQQMNLALPAPARSARLQIEGKSRLSEALHFFDWKQIFRMKGQRNIFNV